MLLGETPANALHHARPAASAFVRGWGGEVNYHVPGRNLAFLYIYGLWKYELYELKRTDNIIIVDRLYCIISLINEIYKRNIKTDLLHSVTVRKNIL